MLVVAGLGYRGDVVPLRTSQISPAVDGVVTVAVELDPGYSAPDGTATDGATIELPAGRSSLLLKAQLGTDYAVRFRHGDRWGQWFHLIAEAHEAPDETVGGEWALGPLRVSDQAQMMEVVLVSGVDRQIDAMFLLDDGPAGGLTGGPEPTVGGTQQGQEGERPAIVPRSGWATEGWASQNNGCEDGPWYADNIQAVIVHHTVTTNNYGPDEVDSLIRAVYYGHVKVNGWCDVGYNFIVDRFGTIWEGRTGGIDRAVIGGHAKGFNTSTSGIALLGQHHPGASPAAASPSTAAADAVQALAAWKLGIHGVDPAGTTWLKNHSTVGRQRLEGGTWHLVPTIMGHRDVGLTSCPGDHGLTVPRSLPAALAPNHPGSPPYEFEGWTPADLGTGFVTLDERGGLRPSGSAALPGSGAPISSATAPAAPPSPGPRAVAARRSGETASGYVLHVDGVLHAFGGAPGIVDRPAGNAEPVDVALADSGGWVVAADGGVYGFGGAGDLAGPTTGPSVVAGSVTPAGKGYLLLANGRLQAVGGVPSVQADAAGVDDAVDVAVRSTGTSGWILDRSGRLHAFGGAPDVAITSPRQPRSSQVHRALVASENGNGGWTLTDDGQLWPFGNERLILGVSTTASANDAVDVALVSPVVSAAFAAGPTGRYLDATVELFLGRSATAADYGHWEGRLRYQGGRQAVTLGLARSEEWAGLRVDEMYQNVLGRSPDAGGRRYWLDEMANGLALEAVGVNFYGSAEYVASSGSTTEYVTRLYQVLLERPPDQAGLRYWVELLQSGRAKPPDVAAGFYASIESRRGRVSSLYDQVLDREPDAEGLGYWAQRLLQIDDVVLAAELAASDEFHAAAIG